MRSNKVYEEYSADKERKFEVYENQKHFEIWVQEKIRDDYYGSDWFQYGDIKDALHIADTMERAIEIGRAYFS